MAYENFFYWLDWENYLGTEDESGYAKYLNVGTILLKTKGHDHRKVLHQYRTIGVKYEEWDLEKLRERMPIYDHHAFWPPKRPEDESFWDESSEMMEGAVYTPESGYVSDPQLATHNLMRAPKPTAANSILMLKSPKSGRLMGACWALRLRGGEQIDAPVVVNVAGPHSFVINRMAGVEEGMNIKTRALRHEVHHVPSPEGFDFEHNGMHTSDGDTALYFRPEVGNTILVGSEDPDCDPQVWVEDPDDYHQELTEAQWKAQVYRLAKRIPNLPIPSNPRGIVDLYDVSDDWIPIYDKSDLNGFYMAIGTSGNQFKNAAGVGYLMAELIDACEKGHDHDEDPVQVKGRYTGLVLNAGFYSRLRAINPDSSFSVNG